MKLNSMKKYLFFLLFSFAFKGDIDLNVSQRNIIFHGNSLFSTIAGTTTNGGRYCEMKIYNVIITANNKLNGIFFSIGGDPTTTKINNWNTQTLPAIKKNDIVILWEITNDVSVNGLTGLQAYNNLVTFANLVHGVGAKIIVGTAIARNNAADGDKYTRNSDCNALVMADNSTFDLKINIGGHTNFVNATDADNTIYYLTDKIHSTQRGSDSIASYFSTNIISSGILSQ